MQFKDQVTPASILEELVLYAQAEPEETEGFCHPSHNNELSPRFLEKTERILSAFEKYVPLKYEVQASQSADVEGADIIARYSSERIADGGERHIAMRITSLDEFQSDGDLLEKIKADISRSEKTLAHTWTDTTYCFVRTSEGMEREFGRFPPSSRSVTLPLPW